MKKNFKFYFFIILITGIYTAYGMTTQTRRLAVRTYKTPKIIYPTKAYQPPVLFNQFKQYYNQLKNRFSEFWYSTTYPKTISDEIDSLLEAIKKNKPGLVNDFDTFMQEKDQTAINNFLNKLIFSENHINNLNRYIIQLQLGLALGVKINEKIAHKIINWIKANITQIFLLDLSIDNNLFLINLLDIDYKLDQGLIPAIHDNLHNIEKTTTGKKFLILLQTQHKNLYDAVIQRKQGIKGMLKESTQRSLKKLQFKE